jgi:hypothetical protein
MPCGFRAWHSFDEYEFAVDWMPLAAFHHYLRVSPFLCVQKAKLEAAWWSRRRL